MLSFECIYSMYAQHTQRCIMAPMWMIMMDSMYIYRCILYVMHLVASKQTPPGSPLHFPALVHIVSPDFPT